MTLTETETVTSLDVEHLCDASIDFEPVQTFPTPRHPAGVRDPARHRRRPRGELLPGGGDWTVVGTDGIVRFDVRATIRTDDGELVQLPDLQHRVTGARRPVARLRSGTRCVERGLC